MGGSPALAEPLQTTAGKPVGRITDASYLLMIQSLLRVLASAAILAGVCAAAENNISAASDDTANSQSTVLPCWDFSDGNRHGWYHNVEWRQLDKAGGVWQLEADDSPEVRIPGDGMMIASPAFTEPVSVAPGDGVEAVLRTSRTGWVTLYYAEVMDGAKLTYAAQRSERRLLYASGDLQTFRIRPRWQDGVRVCQIRLDGPSFGGTLDIHSIRFFHGAGILTNKPTATGISGSRTWLAKQWATDHRPL